MQHSGEPVFTQGWELLVVCESGDAIRRPLICLWKLPHGLFCFLRCHPRRPLPMQGQGHRPSRHAHREDDVFGCGRLQLDPHATSAHRQGSTHTPATAAAAASSCHSGCHPSYAGHGGCAGGSCASPPRGQEKDRPRAAAAAGDVRRRRPSGQALPASGRRRSLCSYGPPRPRLARGQRQQLRSRRQRPRQRCPC